MEKSTDPLRAAGTPVLRCPNLVTTVWGRSFPPALDPCGGDQPGVVNGGLGDGRPHHDQVFSTPVDVLWTSPDQEERAE